VFLISGGEEAIRTLEEEGLQYAVARSLTEERTLLQDVQPDVVMVSKLKNPPEYIGLLKQYAALVVTLDDAGEGGRQADLNLNILYRGGGEMLDLHYLALRPEFQKLHAQARATTETVDELLITQGGSDTYGFTPKIVRALEACTHRPHCTVVVGPTFGHYHDLDEAVGASTLNLTVVRNARNMAELMWKADLAITAGGITMVELACVGTPSLAICGDWFEVETAARLEKAGAVLNLGFGGNLDYTRLPASVDALAEDAEMRSTMSRCGQQLVDGKGCERIVRLIRERVLEGVRTR
jgi:spore coat polysaccharide biosynthesis predicted glycosyltransferase SpsG